MSIAAVFIFWCIVVTVGSWIGFFPKALGSASFERDVVGLIFGLYLPIVWLGRQILARRLWAAWLGFLATLACWVAAVLSTIFPFDPGGLSRDPNGPSRDPNMLVAINMLVAVIVSVVVLSNGLAVWALTQDRRLKLRKLRS
jgi:hypothetical protein